MNARLIPWCLAATGFLAALTLSSRQGQPADPDQPVRSQATVGHRLAQATTERHESAMAQAPAASGTPESGSLTLVLPLPPATEPESLPSLQPLADDAPTVEDLPAPRNPSESP
jgi:hypothetical protein